MRYRTPDDRGFRRSTRYDLDNRRVEPIAREDWGRDAESRFSENRLGRSSDERYEDEERRAPTPPYQSRYDYDAERERASGSFGHRARTGRGPKGYTRSDERILEDVCDRIGLELDASDVEVRIDQGEIRLTGTVGDRQTKYEMEEIADRVLGVKQVHNEIMVRRRYESDERAPGELAWRKRSDPER